MLRSLDPCVYDVHSHREQLVLLDSVDEVVGHFERRIRQTVSDRKQDRSRNRLVVAIADVDVFPLERSAAFGGVVQEGRVVLVPDRERQWKLAGWVDGAEEDACDCVSGLVAAVPGLKHGCGFVDPGHRHWRPRLQHDGGVGGCGAHSVDHGVHVA